MFQVKIDCFIILIIIIGVDFKKTVIIKTIQISTKYLYSIYTTPAQRLRRWANIV